MAAQDASPQLPTGSLHAAPSKSGPGFYWEGHWRYEGRQVKRRLGRAHLVLRDVPDESRKGWQRTHEKPKGAPAVAILSERKAWDKLSEVIAAHAEHVAARALEADERAERETLPTFEAAAQGWLKLRRAQTNAKRKTLDDWASMLPWRPIRASSACIDYRR